MRITVLAVGKVKERWLKDGLAEYSKRLSRFVRLNIIEVADAPDNRSVEDACKKEAERLLAKLPTDGYKVALDLGGQQPDSLAFSALTEDWMERGGSHLIFLIAGSNGFAPEVLQQIDARLSLSNLTFPHQIARLLLLEQLFRAFKISNNETYHK